MVILPYKFLQETHEFIDGGGEARLRRIKEGGQKPDGRGEKERRNKKIKGKKIKGKKLGRRGETRQRKIPDEGRENGHVEKPDRGRERGGREKGH